MLQPLCRTDPGFLIQAQIQRSVCFEGKTSLWIINLHGGHAEISKKEIKTSHFFGNLINGTEILKFNGQNILTEAKIFQSFLGLGCFLMVYVSGIHMPLSLQALKHGLCMTTVAKCGIKASLSWFDLQKINNLFYHNRNMHACRGIPFLHYMLNGILVFLRLKFFIFLLKFLRVSAFVAHSALMRLLPLLHTLRILMLSVLFFL